MDRRERGARFVRSRRHVGLALRVVATVALSWWAVDEIVRGVNPWRRLLGTVVFAGLVVSLLR